MPHPIRLGFSPCPNDAFVFHALVHGLVAPNEVWDVVLEDVETLNGWAEEGRLEVAKVSYHAFGRIARNWWMLPAGGALGHGVGPLIVAREAGLDLHGARIATPGGRTTANLLLGLYAPGAFERVVMRYDQILAAVARGEVDAGLIIHESRFTYASHGLHQVVDLGSWWEQETGHPIPLGGIAVRKELEPGRIDRIARAVQDSVRYAFAHPKGSEAYVAEHAQEMSREVREKHIATYVNDFSIDVGAAGKAAVHDLLARAAEAGYVAEPPDVLFWDGARSDS